MSEKAEWMWLMLNGREHKMFARPSRAKWEQGFIDRKLKVIKISCRSYCRSGENLIANANSIFSPKCGIVLFLASLLSIRDFVELYRVMELFFREQCFPFPVVPSIAGCTPSGIGQKVTCCSSRHEIMATRRKTQDIAIE